jgi:hypothetical protein
MEEEDGAHDYQGDDCRGANREHGSTSSYDSAPAPLTCIHGTAVFIHDIAVLYILAGILAGKTERRPGRFDPKAVLASVV